MFFFFKIFSFSFSFSFLEQPPMCWKIHSSQSGGRGVTYQIISNLMPSILLNNTMYLEEYGWVGAGKARICIGNDGLLNIFSQKKKLGRAAISNIDQPLFCTSSY